MADSDSIKRRLKEDRIPEAFWPDECGEKKKRPKELAVIAVNLRFPGMKMSAPAEWLRDRGYDPDTVFYPEEINPREREECLINLP